MNKILAIAIVVIKELYRRKDFYVLFVLTALITLLMGSVTFFGDDRIVRYLKEICLLLIWISALVIALTTSARQIPVERENRTLFPLLAKPLSRGQFILGKFLGCWLACISALLIFYIFFAVIAVTREQEFMFLAYFQAFWLQACFLAIVIAMSLAGSVIFAAPSSTVTILFIVIGGILLIGRHLFKVAARLTEPSASLLMTVYYAIPHLEFFDIRDILIHNVGLVPWWAVGVATLYAAVYTALFLVINWLIFRKQILK